MIRAWPGRVPAYRCNRQDRRVHAQIESAPSHGTTKAEPNARRSPRERVRALVDSILATRGIGKPFADEDALVEVGLASVDMVSLMLAFESEFDVEIPQGDINPEVFRSVATLEALARRLAPTA
jgi:acyl carrier protein